MTEGRKRMAREIVALEAQLLDEAEWDAWLNLYEEDAQFWVPMWRDESDLTQDPERELSFIYLKGRQFLAERVFRVRSGRSVASNPAPRTAHLIAGSIATASNGDGMTVKSAWAAHVFHHKHASLVTYAGRYEHTLVWRGDQFKIFSKKIIIANDQVLSKLDYFYI